MFHKTFNCSDWLIILSHYPALSVAKKWLFLDFVMQEELALDQAISQWNKKMPKDNLKRSFFTDFQFDVFYDQLEEWGMQWVDYDSQLYPPLLRHIYEPPLGLFVKGQIQLLHKPSLAIVGSRQCSSYGKEVIQSLMADLVGEGLVIVSGLARGADSWAHRLCLEAGGQTVGVIGTGIDLVYPKENRELQVQLAQKHCLLSEYPLHSPPLAFHFPMRNRIIAGLSQATLVVEAKSRSGSLITANLALNEGREVFAVPGSIFSDLSAGCNDLIKHGAKCVLSSQDIVEDLQL